MASMDDLVSPGDLISPGDVVLPDDNASTVPVDTDEPAQAPVPTLMSRLKLNPGALLRKARNKTRRRLMLKQVAGVDTALNKLDLSKSNLRRIFRLFDSNHDNALNLQEFTQCLGALGFETKSDKMLRTVFQAIDRNHGGKIDESQFVTVLSHINRHKLQAALQKTSDDDEEVRITLTEYGVARGDYRRRTLSVAEFASEAATVRHLHRGSVKKDMGLGLPSPKSYSLDLGWAHDDLKTPDRRPRPDGDGDGDGNTDGDDGSGGHRSEPLTPAEAEGLARVRWFDVKGWNHLVLQVLQEEFEISKTMAEDIGVMQPTKAEIVGRDREEKLQVICHALHVSNLPIKADTTRQSLYDLKQKYKQPSLLSEQIILLVLNDHTVLSFRQSSSPTSSNTTSRVQALNHINNISQATLPKTTKLSSLFADIFDPTYEELAADVVSELRTKGAKFLCYRLLENVVEFNLQAKDDLHTWFETLEDSVREEPRGFHLAHLFDVQKLCTDLAARVNASLLQTLSNGSEPRIDNFLRRESSNFKDVEATARALQRTVVTTSENVKSLLNLYNMLSTDRINKVLYVLTLVTTLVTPAQFLSSVYGMNFTEMPELEYRYGYLFWWVGVILLTLIGVILFRRLKFFRI